MSHRQRTVLIVDDNPEDCDLYRQYLLQDRECQYTILAVELGRAGLELWRRYQPDIILLDYRLPDLDGVEFLTELQTMMSQSLLPVIVVTGLGNEAIAVQAMKAGAQNYLVKGNLTPKELQIAVNSAIENLQLRAQLQQSIEKEQLLTHITKQINTSQNLNEVLQTTVNEVRQFLKTDRVFVLQLNSDGRGNVVAESVEPPWQSVLSLNIFDPCLANDYIERYRQGLVNLDPSSVKDYIEGYRQGLVTAKTDIYDGSVEPCHVELLAQFQVRANLVVPILYHDYFWGTLIVHNCKAPRQWQQFEIDLLQELGTHLSIALRQAEALEQLQNELAERKRAEASLAERERQLRLALQAARMGTWDWNIVTSEIQWSANLETLFGFEAGEFDGSWEMFINSVHPQDRDRVQEAVNAAVTKGAEYNIEFRVVYPNGNIRWALSQGKVFYNDLGQPVRMMGVDLDITERKRSEAELQENAAWLKLAQEATKSGLWDYDLTKGKAKISEAYCTLFGLDPSTQEIGYEQWLSLIHPDDRTKISEYIAQVIREQQKYYEIEFRIIHPEGERWLVCRAQAFYDEAGNLIRKTGNVQDITTRKKAENLLKSSEERLQLSLEGSGNGLWDWNIVTGELYLSPRWLSMLGYEVGELPGHVSTWEKLIYPEDKPFVMECLNAHLLDSSVPYKFDYRVLTKSGEPKWIGNYGKVVVRDENNRPLRMAGIHQDISDRKQAEQELRESEARYRYLAEAIPHLVWTCDDQGFCNYVNRRLCEYTGLTFEQALGFGWISSVYPEDRQATLELWQNAIQNSTFYQNEHRVRRNLDGSYRWHLILGLPLKDEQGRVMKWFGTCTDIHDQKELEIERDRILELEQIARNEAEKANRIKDEFLAVLSHELRSPLNPILGWTTLLQTRKLDDNKKAEALATIERNAKLQTQLIDDLLDIARILRGKLSLNGEPVNLTFVIEAAIDTVKTASVAKSIVIHSVLPNIGQVCGDAVRLQQVFWNLLSNAIKFTPNGGKVDILLERLGDQALVRVTDTGKGISPDFLPYIFESFRQEDVSITRKYGGLGLGLAIVRHITEAHGGTVAVDSLGVGKGATFTVSLPLLDAEPESDRSEDLSADELNLTGIKILTIDDEADSRDFLKELLVYYGAQVMTVATSSEFLAAIESFKPDVLVSDIGMPDVDGYTLLKLVRSLSPECGGKTPAIALTAYAGEINQQQALAAGFQRHLSKPIEPDLLVQVIAQLISTSTQM